jgi:hypothetical protein
MLSLDAALARKYPPIQIDLFLPKMRILLAAVAVLGWSAAAAAGGARTSTISNKNPRLDKTGKVVDCHDGNIVGKLFPCVVIMR